MFSISVEADFSAAHALSISGVREPVHGHNWRVVVTLSGTQLDHDGLLADFHTVEGALRSICDEFHNNDLNAHPAFEDSNPSAELVARHIAHELSDRLGGALGEHARIESVSVTEAPRCTATYRPAR